VTGNQEGSGPDLSNPTYYLNRELSELAFQRRVLHEALDDRTPLMERVRFLSIFTRNMDEFFMKRVGGLKQQIDAGITARTVDGHTPREQWEAVLDTARPMFETQARCYHETVQPALAAAGIHVLDYEDLDADEQAAMRTHFEEAILPTLTPLSFDPAHPFPFISNRSLSLAVLTRHHDGDEPTFTRVKVPPNRQRLTPVGEGDRYVPIEEVIRANLDLLFPSVEIVDTAAFRLTRNAEVRRNQEVAEDLIDMIEEVIEQRRFATVVRLELEAGAPDQVYETLVDQLDLDEREVYELPTPLDFRDFETLLDLNRQDLELDPWEPLPHPRLNRNRASGRYSGQHNRPEQAKNIFAEIDNGDILLHHPYHSFTGTVQRFLDEAASDPDVLAIKAAIYRTASDSQVIQTLIDAAENGKQVAVMVELKARFDERNNLQWVHKLEEHGIHVAYGTIGLKTHTKTALVVRDDGDGVRLYSHVGTGNYHSETAKGYVDLGLLTSDQDIGRDLVALFNFFTGPALDEEFRKLLIAPVTMRERFTDLVRREADHARDGRPARIVVKVNGLEDPSIVEELYRASMAGVDIDLVVRDICRLRPGIEGVSETVSVHSIVGRFLEHSRVFYFENGGEPRYYIGSADWMTRNLDNRVEAVAPVTDPALKRQLQFILTLQLSDNRRRWVMNESGEYEQQRPADDEPILDTQAVLMDEARTAFEREGVTTGIACERDLPDQGISLGTTPEQIDTVEGNSHQSADVDGADSADESGVVSKSGEGSETETADGGMVENGGSGDEAASGDAADDGKREDNGATEDGTAERGTATPELDGGSGTEPVPSASANGTRDDAATADGERGADHPQLLVTHRDKWYEPDSATYAYAVRTPDGERRYRKTARGAAKVLRRHYDES
jgi:polyphosphate kinase